MGPGPRRAAQGARKDLDLGYTDRIRVVVRGDEVHVIDAVPPARLVDTTGAGDLYAAGFLFGLSHGYGLAQCGKIAGICAAEVITHMGARPEVSLKDLVKSKLG